MSGRKVLITGSAGHLGRALRAAFEGLGDRVTPLDMYQGDFIGDAWPDASGVWRADLEHNTPPLDALGKHDIVICNAKVGAWEQHAALATLATQCIVNVASIYGVLGNDPKMYEGTEVESTPAWYCASKGALVALTRWQACNLAPVRSNCVAPGGIFRDHSEIFKTRYESRVPLKRMASESDIVGPIVFLCSDAARYVTGQVLMVDGGYSAW